MASDIYDQVDVPKADTGAPGLNEILFQDSFPSPGSASTDVYTSPFQLPQSTTDTMPPPFQPPATGTDVFPAPFPPAQGAPAQEVPTGNPAPAGQETPANPDWPFPSAPTATLPDGVSPGTTSGFPVPEVNSTPVTPPMPDIYTSPSGFPGTSQSDFYPTPPVPNVYPPPTPDTYTIPKPDVYEIPTQAPSGNAESPEVPDIYRAPGYPMPEQVEKRTTEVRAGDLISLLKNPPRDEGLVMERMRCIFLEEQGINGVPGMQNLARLINEGCGSNLYVDRFRNGRVYAVYFNYNRRDIELPITGRC